MRDSTIIYRSFYEAIKELPEKNQAEIWTAIFEFALNFNEVELTGISKTVFTLIKPNIESNNRKYEIGSKNGHLGAEHGKKGGRPKKEKPPTNPQQTPNKPANVDVDVEEEVHEKEIQNHPFVFFGYPCIKNMPSIEGELNKKRWVIEHSRKAYSAMVDAECSMRIHTKEQKQNEYKIFYDQETLEFINYRPVKCKEPAE